MTARKLTSALLMIVTASLGTVDADAQTFFSIGGGNEAVSFNMSTWLPGPAPAPKVHVPLRPGYVYDDYVPVYHSGKKARKEAKKARKEMRKARKHYRKAMKHASRARGGFYLPGGVVEVYPGYYYDDDHHPRHHYRGRHHHDDDDDDDDD